MGQSTFNDGEPVSGPDGSYATVTQFLSRKDARTVGDLVADDDSRVAAGNLPTNPVLLGALSDASGMIESACLESSRYTVEDLTGLTGNSANLLQRLTTDLAFSLLIRRRPYNPEQIEEFKWAEDMLEKLRRGDRIFNVAAVIEAGVPKVSTIRPTTVFRNQLARDTNKMFPNRRFPCR